MYVCLCNGLTDDQIRAAASGADFTTAAGVYAACGARAECGGCTKTIVTLMREARALHPELLAAD